MITVEQIRQLENGVKQAVSVINSLREENALLKTKLSGYEKRIEELEILIESFKQDQSSIEEGIVNALNQLDVLEDIFSKNSAVPSTGEENGGTTDNADSGEDKTDTAEAETNESPENELDIF